MIYGNINKSGREEDREAVLQMFKLMKDVVTKLAPNLQVIVTEHADIAEDWYQQAVVHRWRSGVKLVPDDWPRASA
jgi:energy-converting hydrogenase A subunit M